MSNETAHLHKLGDKAVALCRIPKLSLFVFNLPNCELLRQVTLMEYIPSPLESNDLDQRFLMKDNTMIFMFHDSEFFSDLLNNQDSDNIAGKVLQKIKPRKFNQMYMAFGPLTVERDFNIFCKFWSI